MKHDRLIEALLLELFQDSELRRFVTDLAGTEGIEHNLAPATVPLADVVSSVVNALRRRGLIDGPFFDALRRARPLRRQSIDEVEQVVLHGGEARPDGGSQPRSRSTDAPEAAPRQDLPAMPPMDWRPFISPEAPGRVLYVSGVPLPVAEFARAMNEQRLMGAAGSVAMEFPISLDVCIKLQSRLSARYRLVGTFSSLGAELRVSLTRSGFRPLLTTEVQAAVAVLEEAQRRAIAGRGLIAMQVADQPGDYRLAVPRQVIGIGCMNQPSPEKPDKWLWKPVPNKTPVSGMLHLVLQYG